MKITKLPNGGELREYGSGTKKWYLNGKLHREDGPALVDVNGSKWWYINGNRHREDGPAVEYYNGYKSYYINDKRHREDGPACEWTDGDKEYWLNDKKISQEQFLQLMNLKLKNGKYIPCTTQDQFEQLTKFKIPIFVCDKVNNIKDNLKNTIRKGLLYFLR
jgi:hypothetical protein